MFKSLFKEKSASKVIETHEADVVLRLMFEIAISDGSLDKVELEMIKKRASKSGDNDEKVSKIIKRIIDDFPFIHRKNKLTTLIRLKKKRNCF
jgi:tellurite resistance protein